MSASTSTRRPIGGSVPFSSAEPYERNLSIRGDRKSTRLNSSHMSISYAVFCLKKKKNRSLHPTQPYPLNPTHIPPVETHHHHTQLGCQLLSLRGNTFSRSFPLAVSVVQSALVL